MGSGYGAAVAQGMIGPAGPVISIEIDSGTFGFGKANLEKAGSYDRVLVLGEAVVAMSIKPFPASGYSARRFRKESMACGVKQGGILALCFRSVRCL